MQRAPVTSRASTRAQLAIALTDGLGLGGVATPAGAYDEGTIVSLANPARAQSGLDGLVRDGSLESVALNRANPVANGSLLHNPSVGSQISRMAWVGRPGFRQVPAERPPTPGPEASATHAVSSAGPWIAAGVLVLLALAVAIWPWVASRRRRRKQDV